MTLKTIKYFDTCIPKKVKNDKSKARLEKVIFNFGGMVVFLRSFLLGGYMVTMNEKI
jgi:hypothetical protein